MSWLLLIRRVVLRLALWLFVVFPCFLVVLYSLVSAPPLSLLGYEKSKATLSLDGARSIYVPGAGFSGFWFHLGVFSELIDHGTDDDDVYYCYSSGCLSLLLAYTGLSVQDIYQIAQDAQQSWWEGTMQRHEIVPHFIHHAILGRGHHPADQVQRRKMQSILPRIRILVTSRKHGVTVHTPQPLHNNDNNTTITAALLADMLIATAYIPWVTAPFQWLPWLSSSSEDVVDWVLDGGFSRRLHPVCDETISVPITWDTTVYTLYPGFGLSKVQEFYEMGRRQATAASSAASTAMRENYTRTTTTFTTTGEENANVQSQPLPNVRFSNHTASSWSSKRSGDAATGYSNEKGRDDSSPPVLPAFWEISFS